MFKLNTPISELNRVGKTVASRLKTLGIFNVKDLLFHFPFRYDDYSQVLKISELKPEIPATVKGKIKLLENRRARRRKMYITEALVYDETGTIKVIWFNQPYLSKTLKPGDQVYLSGKVDLDHLGLQFTNPSFEKTQTNNLNTGRLVPVYPLTANITQKQLRFLIGQVLGTILEITEFYPQEMLSKYNLVNIYEALKQIHYPDSKQTFLKAQRRLKFDELFLIQIVSQVLKQELEDQKSPLLDFKEAEIKKFVDSLSFKLTDDQRKASWEILQDLEKTKPMNRLLEGDVGSGKTVVAAMALLNTVLNGYQAVIMAPTEILAKQHYKSLKNLFSKFELNIGLLIRTEKKVSSALTEESLSKKKFLESVKDSTLQIIVGTQALIQEGIDYKDLGLVIIDEQHRFGVEQRKKLKDKTPGLIPHFLSMTATPIPRTYALILYSDLDLSLIKQMPKGRKKIITKLIEDKDRREVYNFIKQVVAQGRQIFWVCPLIDESDKLGVKAATIVFEKLKQDIFSEFKVGLLHGRLKKDEKEEVMAEFVKNKINILVTTAVIEVGVDVPNATTMVIEGADRFGLAQLHQFRGRVGRSDLQSYCFLFSDNLNSKTRERLTILTQSEDGFHLAEQDLMLRGPGEFWGQKQSGLPNLKIADFKDMSLIKETQEAAQELILQNPELAGFEALKAKILEYKDSWHNE